MILRNLIISVAILSLQACFSKPKLEFEKVPESYDVEVVTIDKVALETVNNSKTDFFVPTYEDSATWDRTKIFFVKYLGIKDLRSSIVRTKDTTTITARSKSGYEYQVKRELFGNGYNYFVKCRPVTNGATYDFASRNAKNLSRFIVDGTLETTLLK